MARSGRRAGLAARPARPAAAALSSGLLLDYALYLWQVLLHRVPALWRFHAVHHSDPDLDLSTAARFHFGEMILSVPWRLLQLAVIGPSPRALRAWQVWLAVSVAFHHSNLRLPLGLERVLARLVMTPRLHGIHHAERAEARSSNWSSGLTLWDLVHGTFWFPPGGGQPRIGLRRLQPPTTWPLRSMLAFPFRREAGRLAEA